jgi:exodeoxyribonuclease V alpha subunit
MRLKLKLVKQIYSSENGYSVINCDAINEKGKVAEYDLTLTGFLLPSKKNAVFEAEVEKVNTKYGEQYKVHTYEEKDPEDDEGIVALILASKLRGIGKKKAQKIVQKFGQETLYVLDNEFERLKEIKGFPTKNLKIAEKQWKDSRELRELMVVVGNSTNISQKIF